VMADTACQPWATSCDVSSGVFESAAPTATTDRVCDAGTDCSSVGAFQTNPLSAFADAVCAPLSQCTHVCARGTSPYGACTCSSNCLTCTKSRGVSGDGQCTQCRSGNQLHLGQCVAQCPAGGCVVESAAASEYEVVPPSPTTDRVCARPSDCISTQ
jgi:hypothetical protein